MRIAAFGIPENGSISDSSGAWSFPSGVFRWTTLRCLSKVDLKPKSFAHIGQRCGLLDRWQARMCALRFDSCDEKSREEGVKGTNLDKCQNWWIFVSSFIDWTHMLSSYPVVRSSTVWIATDKFRWVFWVHFLVLPQRVFRRKQLSTDFALKLIIDVRFTFTRSLL